jgi:CubicO group peptidase (beta-lactamase class C family)
VGSIAKTYTGLLLAELAVEGRVDLHAPIDRVVTELAGRPIGTVTPQQLLTHSAGWIDSGNAHGRADDAALGDTMKVVPDSWVLTAPGRVYSYSNGGFAMAGYVAERATGTPFLQLLDERVLGRTSLDHATYRPLVAMTREFSLGHVATKDKGVGVQRPMPNNSGEYPAGFLYVTAADLVRLGSALMSDGMLDGKQVVSPKAVALQTDRYIAIPGSPDKHAGLGIDVDRVGGEPVWRKSGAMRGFYSELSMWPDRRFAVAVSTNLDGNQMPIQANRKIAQLVHQIGTAAPSAVTERAGTPAERAATVGRYRLGADTIVEIAEQQDELEVRMGGGTFPIRFVGKDRLIVKAPPPIGREVLLLRDADGNVEFLHSRQRAYVKLK